MSRFTAMRTAKIAAAIAGPLTLMTFYLTWVYGWRSDYLLTLLIVLLLISLSPTLSADPIAEDEAAPKRRGKGLESLVLLSGLIAVLGWPYYCWLLVFLLISDPLAPRTVCISSDEAARTRCDKNSSSRAILIGLSTGLMAWLFGRPEVVPFLASLKPHLRDWKPTTAVALLCLLLMRWGLRKAMTFTITDLYPHLRRTMQDGPLR